MQVKIILLLAIIVCAGCKKADDHLTRARTLMSKAQWANARTALGQALKDRPNDVTARSLLLYCIDREDGLAAVADLSLYGLFQFARAAKTPGWESLPGSLRKIVEKSDVDARKALFDKGVDSKDDEDLVAVIVATARYGFAHDDEPERRDMHAAILGIGGDAKAIAYLVDRLKSAQPERVVEYLVDVGPAAREPLRAVTREKGFIGRRAALDALARVLATDRATELVTKYPKLRDPTGESSKAGGRTRLSRNVLSVVQHLGVLNIHGMYAPMDDGAEDGLVILQSWDDGRGSAVSEAYAFANGTLRPLRVHEKSGAVADLGGGALVYEISVDRGLVLLRRAPEQTADVEVDDGRVKAPKPGVRVRLQGYEPHGEIVREDGGLWVVKVDKPIEGMTELPVAANSMVSLRSERRTEVSIETIVAKVRADKLEIQTRTAVAESSDGKLPPSCQQYKLMVERLQRCDELPQSTRTQLQSLSEQLVDNWKGLRADGYASAEEACRTGSVNVRDAAGFICGL